MAEETEQNEPQPQAPPRIRRNDVVLLARKHTADAIKTLHAIMTDPTAPAAARITAADKLLCRAWGSAPNNANVIRNLPPGDLKRLAAKIQEQREASSRPTLEQ